MHILIVGRTGQLARHLQATLAGQEVAFTAWGRDQLDWTSPLVNHNQDDDALYSRIRDVSPSHIINATAYTAVDKAEEEPDVADAVNHLAPRQLALAAARLGIPFVHVSTDYVFDGTTNEPYEVNHPVNPLNVYGASKLAGEEAIRETWSQHWIVRTSWVFSEHGSNFVKTMLRLANERDELGVVADQFGRPTYAGDLARVLCGLVTAAPTAPFGTNHASGGTDCSWYDFACEIFTQALPLGLIRAIPKVEPITTEQFPTPAARPAYGVMAGSDALRRVAPPPDWRVGLQQVLKSLA